MQTYKLPTALIAAQLALGATAALAGGPTVVESEPAVTAPAASEKSFWDGAWAGVSLGRGNTNFDIGALVTDPIGDEVLNLNLPDLGAEGSSAGFSLGYDRQVKGNWVAGVQIDGAVTSITNDAGFQTVDLIGSDDVDFGYSLTQSQTVSGLARVGFLPSESTMIYGLAGATRGEFTADYAASVNGTEVTTGGYDFAMMGTTLGAGIETRLSDKLSLKLEYRMTDFGAYSLVDLPVSGGNISADMATKVQVVTAALVMHF